MHAFARQELTAGIAEQHRGSGVSQVARKRFGRAARIADIADQDEVERREVVADRVRGCGVDSLGGAIEPRVHAAGRSGERVDVQCRHTRSAGEHGRDGDDAAAAAEQGPPQIAVTAVSDERKGERLVVIHTALEKTPEELCRALAAAGLPTLWVPSPDSFVEVETIPVLGTGKLDLRALKEVAEREFAREN